MEQDFTTTKETAGSKFPVSSEEYAAVATDIPDDYLKYFDEEITASSETEINQRVEKAVQFLTRYFRNSKGYAYIWLKNKQSDDAKTLCFNLESQAEISAAVKRAMELNANEFYDAYFGVNVGKTFCDEKSRHTKENIQAQIAIVADIDINNAAHHKGNAEKYPADSDFAISFLPVKPTILINSGAGIHAYYKFSPPLEIANIEEGVAAALRGKKFLDVIRSKAGTFSKAIDGVHDLPRILRLPYSFNCKDRQNLKLCTVIYDTENYFTPAQIDEIISAAYFKPAENMADLDENFRPQVGDTPKSYADSQDPPEYELARRLEMLRVIDPAALSDNEWLAVISTAKNEGLENYIDDWNKRDMSRYNEAENKKRLDSLKDTSFDIATLAGIAKRFGYVEGDFKRQWYRDNPQFSKSKSSAAENVITQIFGDKRNFVVPYGYCMTRNSLSVEVKAKNETQLKVFAELPFYISNYYRRGDGTYCVDVTTLSFTRRAVTVKQIPKGDLSDARKIAPLGNTDLPFTSNYARQIIDYVQKFLAANSQILKVADLHEKAGWLDLDDKQIFVSPYSDKFVIDKNNESAKHLRVKGKYEDFLVIFRKIFYSSPVARFTIDTAFSSLILPIIGCRPFVEYLRSKSKAGKSAVFKFAAGLFGDREVLKSFNATVNSLEGVIADISPFPAIFDEKQVAGANFDISNFIYRAGLGQGRGRCNRDGSQRDTKKWGNVTICNGEERPTESAKTQGLHTRTLELNFSGDKILDDDLAQDIHIMFDTQKNFGFGGKIFIEKLQAENLDTLPDAYKIIGKTLKEKFPAYIDEHCRYIAAATVADILVQKFFFDVTDEEAAFQSALDNAAQIFKLIDTQINLSDEQAEKDFITGWIAENRLHFEGMPVAGNSERLTPPIYGQDAGDYVYIIAKSLKEALTRAGYSYSKVKADMIEAGVFVKVDGADTVQKKIGGVNCRCVKFSRKYEK